MGKGQITREAILDRAVEVATRSGLEGLSIGSLAQDLEMSKSGLFAHFQSKETLQIQVLEAAAERFVDVVVRPSLTAARGEPRVRALFENWIHWPRKSRLPGGCMFVAAATELDDRPGLLRDALVKMQRDWMDTMAHCARIAVDEGHFRKDLDCVQFAHELYGIMLMCHHSARLMRDKKAEERTRAAFDSLLQRSRPPIEKPHGNPHLPVPQRERKSRK
jgi:AcrR family transcriptional regulator